MKKRILSLLVALAMLCAFVPVIATATESGKCGADVIWTLDDDGTLTISGTGDMWDSYEYSDCESPFSYNENIKEVVIEDGVTGIGQGAFYGCEALEKITIADGVTSIGENAFSCTAYEEDESNWENSVLYIGSCLIEADYDVEEECIIKDGTRVIADDAFINTYMESVTIPDTVTHIGRYAFEYCEQLESITIPNSVTEIGEYAFFGCSELADITISDNITSIGSYAFAYTAYWENESNWEGEVLLYIGSCLVDVYYGVIECTVKDGTRVIAAGAFADSYLESIDIPDTVIGIGAAAFAGCYPLEITVDEENTVYSSVDGVLFGKDKTEILAYGKDGKSYVIPNGVVSIGESAFNESYLKSVTIPDTVTEIGRWAFYNCDGITSIAIPASVKTIGYGAFDGTDITEVYYEGSEEEWESLLSNSPEVLGLDDDVTVYYDSDMELEPSAQASEKCGYNVTWTLDDDGVLTISGAGDMWSGYEYSNDQSPLAYDSSIKEVVIEYGVTSIGEEAFCGCKALEKITIADSVTSIGYDAFASTAFYEDEDNWENGALYIGNCLIAVDEDITEYTIKDGTRVIADYAFAYGSVENVTIPDTVTHIGEGAFRSCKQLESITIPNSVMEIGDDAFMGCALKSITIPDSVTKIGGAAFQSCKNLEEITVSENITSIGSNVFTFSAYYEDESNWEDGTLYLGKYLIATDENDEIWEYAVKEETKVIARFAFSNWSDLRSVTIPDSVIGIGANAFYGFTRLEITVDEDNPSYSSVDGVLFNKDKTEILAYAKCKITSDYTIPDGVVKIGESAFDGCVPLKSITIPETVTEIGECAFADCRGLASIAIPASLKRIEHWVFDSTKIAEVYYGGSKEDWENLLSNSSQQLGLGNATIYYDSVIESTTEPTTEPTAEPTEEPLTPIPTAEPTEEPVVEVTPIPTTTATVGKDESDAEYLFTVTPEVAYENCVVYVALYDTDGRLLAVSAEKLETDGATIVLANKNDNAAKAKVFIFGNTIQAIVKAKEFEL